MNGKPAIPRPLGFTSSLLCLLAVTIAGSAQRAEGAEHPISVIEADAFVNRTKVTLRLNLFAEDLYLFHPMEPNELDYLAPYDLERALQDHKSFLLERVLVRDAEGTPLEGQVTDLTPFEIPPEGIPVSSLMEYAMQYVLEFTLDEPPEFLTFTQEIVDPNFVFPSEMKLRIKQSGTESDYMTILRPGTPETLRFDWSRPPLSDDASAQEWEEWLEYQRDQTLGITSYSSVYSFIYLEPREVRHEVLVPLVNLATLIDIPRRDPAFLDIDEQDAVRESIIEYFREGNAVRIDGVVVPPVFDRVDFYGLNLRDFAQQSERQKVSMASGRVGLIMAYRSTEPPRRVEITWDQFSSTIRTIESVVIAGDEMSRFKFSKFQEPEENTFTWDAPDRDPLPPVEAVAAPEPVEPGTTLPAGFLLAAVTLVVGLVAVKLRDGPMAAYALIVLLAVGAVAAGIGFPQWGVQVTRAEAPAIGDAQAGDIFRTLHRNVYRAFEYPDEDSVYDALAASISGDLLRDVYLQIQESLKIQEQGGAVSRIEEVTYVEGDRVEAEESGAADPSFAYDCTWTVRGTVEHWGHIHERTNQYQARFTVQLEEDAWKITRMDLRDSQRIGSRTDLRRF